MDSQFLQKCKQVRLDVIEMARFGRRGHIASAFSIVESLVILFDYIMHLKPDEPKWKDRDRFILSKGHGCMSYYSVLARAGFFSTKEYESFCKHDGMLGGHPTKEKIPGCEASTGSLGHGLSIAVGLAINAKIEKRDYRTFVMLGDGECNEGSIWEAALSASKNKLDNLVAMVDYNKFQSYSSTEEVCDMEPFGEKWKAFGFEVREVDMRKSPWELKGILDELPLVSGKPTAIILHTIKGQGISFVEGDLTYHHKSKIKDEELEKMIRDLD
jgi:transketolase